ncbi:zinc finger and BTB domain-containing protein 41-like isoform X1 [Lycorma delicatula]|uniref:zinc finger and BTB domain-containing protein 41-like isoform X1 n=1 Tax=Lycorma delicatula TaxID=130591 RepID=UPI003F50E3B7
MTDVVNVQAIKQESFSDLTIQSEAVVILLNQADGEGTRLNSDGNQDENRTANSVEGCGSPFQERKSNGCYLQNSETFNLIKQSAVENTNPVFTKMELKETQISHTNSDKNFTCPYCQKKFDCVSTFEKHKEIHIGGWPFTCKICHKGFPFHHLLEAHSTFHKTETFTCDACDKKCVSRYKLKVHMKVHINQFSCRICKQMFSTKESLKGHKSIHKKSGIKKQIHVCKICSATFPVHFELKLHLRMHSTDWPFSCDVCKKLYRQKGSFLTHVSKCLGMNPYTCDICKKTFIRQCHFVEHVQQTHNGIRPFNCSICHKRFNSKSNLEIHSQVHSARLPTIYKCSLCQQIFNSTRKLRGHKIREHSLYRPYKCSTCKKLFLFKSQLSNHSKEHKVKEL